MQHAFTTSEALGTARRYWQMSLVRGVLAIIAGLVILLWPHLAYSLFFTIFGVFAIVEGVLLIANGYLQRHKGSPATAASQRSTFYQSSASTTAPQSTSFEKGKTYQKPSAAGPGSTAAERAASFEPDATLEETISERAERTSQQATPAGAGATYQQAAPTGAGATYQAPTGAPSASHQAGAAYQQPLGSILGAGSTTQMVAGVLSVICGLLCLVLPGVVGALVVYAVAAWAMFRGISALMQAHERGWVVGAIGVLAIILSLFLFIDPIGAIRTFLWGVGLFMLIMGILLVARALQHNLAAAHATPPLEPTY